MNFITHTKLLVFLVTFFYFKDVTRAQELDSNNTKMGISISYFSQSGYKNTFLLSYEKYMFQNNKYNFFRGCSLLYENKPRFYNSLGFLVTSGIRRTFKSGLFLEYAIKIGYIGSYYSFDTYEMNSSGEIVNLGKKTYGSLIFGNSIGLGYDFNCKTKYNLQLFAKPLMYYRFPYNDNLFINNNVAMEFGVIIHPKNNK